MSKRKITFVERRSHLRIPMSIKATLKLSKDRVISAKTKNISFGGTFVKFQQTPIVEPGDYFSIELFSRVKFTVKVVHLNEDGIGFQFDFILIKYYESFKKMMLLNATDPDRLIKELGRQAERCKIDS